MQPEKLRAVKNRKTIRFTKKSLTKQSFKDEANINNIMARYEKTGVVDNVMVNPGQYGDFSEVTTYQESLNKIYEAQVMFDSLPAQIRAKFENDPVLFVEFCSDENNHEKLVEMGLAQKVKKDEEIQPKIPEKTEETEVPGTSPE